MLTVVDLPVFKNDFKFAIKNYSYMIEKILFFNEKVEKGDD